MDILLAIIILAVGIVAGMLVMAAVCNSSRISPEEEREEVAKKELINYAEETRSSKDS